jgi:hypothetical protein
MDNYAKGFNKGLTGDDILYFGKLEQTRRYNGKDESLSKQVEELKEQGKDLKNILHELKGNKANIKNFYDNGRVFNGEPKPGLQTHVHVVVSRMDKTQTQRLSPNATSRGNAKTKLNGKYVTKGIDKSELSRTCQASFDKTYNFNRGFEQSYDYQKFNKNPAKEVSKTANTVKTVSSAIKDPEGTAKNMAKGMAIKEIDKLAGMPVASTFNKAADVAKNPELAKDMLINQAKELATKILPPQVQAAVKVAEVAKDIAKGITDSLLGL